MNTLQYFGTNTRSAGHYMWEFDATGQYMSGVNLNFKGIPFNPEDITRSGKGWIDRGMVEYGHADGWTYFGISGSPIDKRGGCKSVFFINKVFSLEQMVQKIKMTPAAYSIVKAFDVPVQYFTLTGTELEIKP